MGNKLIVTRNFDYHFPSGSLVAFKASTLPVTTKQEIVDYAVSKGFGLEPQVPTQPVVAMPV